MSATHDFRFALRMLRHEPGLAATAILTLALGVGANTAVFSIVNAVLLAPLPYPEPDRLVTVQEVVPAVAKQYPALPVNAWHYSWWTQHARSFESVSAADFGSSTLSSGGNPELIDSARVSANTFATLGVQPALGRTFAPGEDQGGRPGVLLITDALWRRRFGADPGVVGRQVVVDAKPFTVIGVLPPRFAFPKFRADMVGSSTRVTRDPELFRPLAFSAEELQERMGRFNYTVMARIRRGTSIGEARSEMNVLAGRIEAAAGEKIGLQAVIQPLTDSVVGGSRKALLVLLAAVGAVLLIACLNLASLLLARAERRTAEQAVRRALGASPVQIFRQVLIEVLLLAGLGGATGVALAWAALDLLVAAAPADIPRLAEVRIDGSVLLFGLGVSLATGLIFGLAPLWRSLTPSSADGLRGTKMAGGGVSGSRIRSGLIAAEVGLSLTLLVTAGLLGASFGNIVRSDMGFDAPEVLAARLQIPMERYREPADRDRFHERVLAALTAQPGVAGAAVVTALPLTGETWVDGVSVPGDTRSGWERLNVNVRFVSPGYFETMGISLVGGRTFTSEDRPRKPILISRKVAEALWPGQDAVGRKLDRSGESFEVVGVVRDVRAQPDKPAPPVMYRPYWDWSPGRVDLVARGLGDPRALAGAMRAAVRSVDPDVPLANMHTLREIFDESVAQRRFQLVLAGSFAAAALLLAGLGVYGVVAYSVARRRAEIGLRIALGAGPADLYGMVLRHGLRPVLAGLLAGAPAALAAGALLRGMLYEVDGRSPLLLGSLVCLLLLVGLAACVVPARRAASVAPIETLRAE